MTAKTESKHMNEAEKFISMVADSEALRGRWETTVKEVTTAAKDLYGVDLSPTEISDIFAVRVAVLSGQRLDDYAAELTALPRVSAAVRKAAILAGDVTVRAECQAELDLMPTGTASQARAKLNRARELGVATPPPSDNSGLNDVQKLQILLSLPAGQRMHYARQWGVGV